MNRFLVVIIVFISGITSSFSQHRISHSPNTNSIIAYSPTSLLYFVGMDIINEITPLTKLIENNTSDSRLSITPNPVEDYFRFSGSFIPSKFMIYDYRGTMHYRSESITEKINLKNLRSGPYILKAENQSGDIVSKIFYKL